MIRHIVFDIGRVLVHYDPEIPYRRLIPDPDRRRWFLDEVCSPAWNLEQDRGRGWQEAEAVLVGQYPEVADLVRAFRANWAEMVPHAVDGTPRVLEALVAAGHDVTMLTNFNDETFAIARQRFAFLDLPRGVTVSAEVGMVKPEPAIYAHHVETFDLTPAETLFFDDSPANVKAARAAGWQARLFTDAETMRSDLAAAGIAVP